MKVRAYIAHKLSEGYSDCQDRFCINKDYCRVAVSDGMSQSVFPDFWADILSKYYAFNGHCNDEDRKNLCSEWEAKVKDSYEKQKAQGKNPWMLGNLLVQRRGAGATLCGVAFDDAQKWSGHVLGDSCAIEIDLREKCLLRILSSEEKSFDCSPDYYDSYPEKAGKGMIRDIDGSINENKMLLLASDPFSEFLQKNRNGCIEMIEDILTLESHESFCEFVKKWRQKGLHNDDSTLCIVEFDGSASMNIFHEDCIDDLIEKEKTHTPLPENEESVSELQKPVFSEENKEKDIFAEEVTLIPEKQVVPLTSNEESDSKKDHDSSETCDHLFDNIKKELEKLNKNKDFKLGKVLKVLHRILRNFFESKNEK